MTDRDWSGAVAFWHGKPCIVTNRVERELAHIIPRANDVVERTRRGARKVVVLAQRVLPLHPVLHEAYDRRRLNIWSYLEQPQVASCHEALGEQGAMRYILGPDFMAWSRGELELGKPGRALYEGAGL